MTTPIAYPPETLEGWYVLHQIFRSKRTPPTAAALEAMAKRLNSSPAARTSKRPAGTVQKGSGVSAKGWSCCARLIGSKSDLMIIHFRESLDAIGAAQDNLARVPQSKDLELVYSFLS